MSMLFKRIKDWATSITAFRTGDVIPVDGPSGTAKMSKDDLLKKTAQNALAGNVALAFDPTRTSDNVYTPGQVVEYEGGTYMFINSHYGAWASADVVAIDVFGREDYKLKNFINKSIEGNSPIAMQFNNDCVVDSSYKLVQTVKSDYRWGGSILSADKFVRFKLLDQANYIIVATALSHRFVCLAICIGGSGNGTWYRFTDTGYVVGSTISDFPTFDTNNVEIIRINYNTIKIYDYRGHSINVNLLANGFVRLNSWWLRCFGIVTTNYYDVGHEYAVILNYGSFSCLTPNYITQEWIEDKMSKNILSPTLKCFSHNISVDGLGNIVANSYNGKLWGGIVFTEDTLSFKFVNADNYIILAYQNAPGWSFIGIGVTGSSKGQFVLFDENGFYYANLISGFPTLNRYSINVSRTGSTYEISDGSNSVSVQLSSFNLPSESYIPAIGLVTSKYYPSVPYTYGQITNLSQTTSLKFLNNYKKLAGKKIVVLGDSITAQGRFTSALAEVSGCVVDNSFGISGTTISSMQNSFINRISSMPTDVDYVLVFGGVNDWQLGVTLGQFSDGVSDTSKFYGACHTMMNELTNKYRNGTINIPILWMTPCHAQFQGATIHETEYPAKLEYSVTSSGLVANSYGGGILEDYVTAIRKVAEFYGVEVIDTYSESGLAPLQNSNRTKFFTDGLHPNDAGGMMIAKTVYRKLKDIS